MPQGAQENSQGGQAGKEVALHFRARLQSFPQAILGQLRFLHHKEPLNLFILMAQLFSLAARNL